MQQTSVVSIQYSTSNHNPLQHLFRHYFVVSIQYSTSNHNIQLAQDVDLELYLFSILHQTTTLSKCLYYRLCCIYSVFYIKPQPCEVPFRDGAVVSIQYSTSNHNNNFNLSHTHDVVSIQYSTSNHNRALHRVTFLKVVSIQYSTSNHNPFQIPLGHLLLYLFSILHQTTTRRTFFQLFILLYLFSILHQTTTCKYATSK